MPKVNIKVNVQVEVSDAQEELIKVVGRELIAGINQSINENENVEEIEVQEINANVSLNYNCLPEKEINELGNNA